MTRSECTGTKCNRELVKPKLVHSAMTMQLKILDKNRMRFSLNSLEKAEGKRVFPLIAIRVPSVNVKEGRCKPTRRSGVKLNRSHQDIRRTKEWEEDHREVVKIAEL